jgi:hypothetical protein
MTYRIDLPPAADPDCLGSGHGRHQLVARTNRGNGSEFLDVMSEERSRCN